MGTQRSKLELFERRLERVSPYKMPNRGLLIVGVALLTYVWRVLKTAEVMEVDGTNADVKWVEEAEPNKSELLETAEIVNMVENTEIDWEAIE